MHIKWGRIVVAALQHRAGRLSVMTAQTAIANTAIAASCSQQDGWQVCSKAQWLTDQSWDGATREHFTGSSSHWRKGSEQVVQVLACL